MADLLQVAAGIETSGDSEPLLEDAFFSPSLNENPSPQEPSNYDTYEETIDERSSLLEQTSHMQPVLKPVEKHELNMVEQTWASVLVKIVALVVVSFYFHSLSAPSLWCGVLIPVDVGDVCLSLSLSPVSVNDLIKFISLSRFLLLTHSSLFRFKRFSVFSSSLSVSSLETYSSSELTPLNYWVSLASCPHFFLSWVSRACSPSL